MARVFPASEVVDRALELGFDLAGITPLRPPRAADRFREWLRAGRHAGMSWMEAQRERILDPRRSLPGGHSLLVVGLGHSRAPQTTSDGARVARYAAGRDYHNVVGRKLRKLARVLRDGGVLGNWKKVVDAGPLLERSHGAEAGLGFESKAANLLHPRFGPWFFLGELLLEADVEPTPTPPAGSCGTCTACLDSCPTSAIRAPGVVDAGLCLSYQTIENRGPVPHELRGPLGRWVFGCDVCSEVCPFGKVAPDLSARFGTHAAIADAGIVDWLRLPEASFAASFEGSPLRRPGRDGLRRNVALVLGNHPTSESQSALAVVIEDPSPLVREAAFWGLAKAHGNERPVRAWLERALERESDPVAREGMQRTQLEQL